jgi:hypothetical protein
MVRGRRSGVVMNGGGFQFRSTILPHIAAFFLWAQQDSRREKTIQTNIF